MSFRLWEAHEWQPYGCQAFVLLREQRGNRNPADRGRFGCGAARHIRRNKTRDKRKCGRLRVSCALLQRAKFRQSQSGERQEAREVPQLPANTRKAGWSRGE